ncbi:Uncharacterized protein PKNOH_S140227600 [Plasmodium knowlesi]|uniref:Uncharacterized protein n=2 Tax=Plasmodium knowlesi TaxID=5850 RepID=A0A1A7W2R3_PLAKH|nr:Uncharacterized protein PKNOH_S140227600 [Plasmodium knowlesi]SBO28654.1 hypothetical protein PKNA1_H1_1410450 [Plasmodium knowlesi strain H]
MEQNNEDRKQNNEDRKQNNEDRKQNKEEIKNIKNIPKHGKTKIQVKVPFMWTFALSHVCPRCNGFKSYGVKRPF